MEAEQVLMVTISNNRGKSKWHPWSVDINGEKYFTCSKHSVLLRIEDAMRELTEQKQEE